MGVPLRSAHWLTVRVEQQVYEFMIYQRMKVLSLTQGDIYWLAEPQTGLLERLYQLEPDPDPVRLFEGTAFSPQASQSPLLFSLSSIDGLVKSLMADPRMLAGLLIVTEASRKVLLSHLQSLLEARFQQHRRALLRYYDPRVASYLLAGCTDSMLPRWLGPVNALAWFGGTWADEYANNLSWQSLSWQGEKLPSQQQPLALSEEQLQRMVDQSLEQFAWEWLLDNPGHGMSQTMEWINAGIAAGHDEHRSLTAWLDDRLKVGEHYA